MTDNKGLDEQELPNSACSKADNGMHIPPTTPGPDDNAKEHVALRTNSMNSGLPRHTNARAEDGQGIATSSENSTKSEDNGDSVDHVDDKRNHHNSDLVEIQAEKKNDKAVAEDVKPNEEDGVYEEKPYSILTFNEKRIIILCAGFCQFFSPISSQIYYPSLNEISRDLDVSHDLVNLTITVYLIMQGIAPAFVGGFSDSSGRRLTYFCCFVIYGAANIGLGIQNNYAALMVLRCLQSAGGSGTVALANAVVADIITSQERGTYVSYMSVAPQAGPSLGPIIGGLLGQYLGWHSVFWFLLIATGVVALPTAFLMMETNRKIADDGSVPPPRLYRCWLNTKVEKRLISEGKTIPWEKRAEFAKQRKTRFPNPLLTLRIVLTKEAGYILGYVGLLCAAYYATITLIPSQFGKIYGFNQIQIALCYLPLGAGSTLAALVRGRMMDSRYRYHAKRLGMPLKFNRKADLSNFPIERVRLEVAIPTIAIGAASFIGFGWLIQYKVNLSAPLIFLFVIGFCVSSSINTVSVLLVDIYPGNAASATAANNLIRCWLGAGATSGVVPLIHKIGNGWTTTFFGLLVIVASPTLWYVMKNGPKWRKAAKEKKERAAAQKAAAADVAGEKGGA